MEIFKIKPELISIHVPKTAGSTFNTLLKRQYGLYLKHIQAHKDLHIWNNGLIYRSNKPFVKAVHGHIEAHPTWLSQYPEAKLIAWVRDPVERVISAYFHWKKEMDHRDARHQEFLKLQPDLIEFAQLQEFKPTVNALQTYLGRLNPDAYFFIGRTEFFEEDFNKIASRMGWGSAKIEKRNVNQKKPKVSDAIKKRLKKELKSEYQLQRKLLAG